MASCDQKLAMGTLLCGEVDDDDDDDGAPLPWMEVELEVCCFNGVYGV